MLYLIYRRNEELTYKGGQEPIVHLEADLHATIAWAQQNARRWAFTLSNAGAYYFESGRTSQAWAKSTGTPSRHTNGQGAVKKESRRNF